MENTQISCDPGCSHSKRKKRESDADPTDPTDPFHLFITSMIYIKPVLTDVLSV